MSYFENSYNFTNWKNENYQSHLISSKRSDSEEERIFHLKEAEKILMKEMPVIPVYDHTYMYLNDHIKDLLVMKFNYVDFKYAYFSK